LHPSIEPKFLLSLPVMTTSTDIMYFSVPHMPRVSMLTRRFTLLCTLHDAWVTCQDLCTSWF
jgi:hypothetical protein